MFLRSKTFIILTLTLLLGVSTVFAQATTEKKPTPTPVPVVDASKGGVVTGEQVAESAIFLYGGFVGGGVGHAPLSAGLARSCGRRRLFFFERQKPAVNSRNTMTFSSSGFPSSTTNCGTPERHRCCSPSRPPRQTSIIFSRSPSPIKMEPFRHRRR